MIITFNETLKKVLADSKLPHVGFLDMMQEMIIPHISSEEEKKKQPLHNSGFILLPELNFDGTHLNPIYISSVLQPCINSFFSKKI